MYIDGVRIGCAGGGLIGGSRPVGERDGGQVDAAAEVGAGDADCQGRGGRVPGSVGADYQRRSYRVEEEVGGGRGALVSEIVLSQYRQRQRRAAVAGRCSAGAG